MIISQAAVELTLNRDGDKRPGLAKTCLFMSSAPTRNRYCYTEEGGAVRIQKQKIVPGLSLPSLRMPRILDMSTFSFLLASCRILHNAFQATNYIHISRIGILATRRKRPDIHVCLSRDPNWAIKLCFEE